MQKKFKSCCPKMHVEPSKSKGKKNSCSFCNKEIAEVPWLCRYCGGIFCADHYLPENHACVGLREKSWKRYAKEQERRKVSYIPKGEFHISGQEIPTPEEAAHSRVPPEKPTSNEGDGDGTRCFSCGRKITGLSWRCRYCGRIFCADHRLPENHGCPITLERSWKKYAQERKRRGMPRKPISKVVKRILRLSFASLLSFMAFFSGLLILGNKFGLFSLPWVETIGIVHDWSYHIGIFLLILGGFGIAMLLKSRKGRIVFPVVCIIIFFVLEALSPAAVKVLFWRGEDGEKMEELVKEDFFAIVVGADGHRIWLHNNPNARNPTYQELLVFLAQDNTDQIPYDPAKFVCADYAERLHNNAEKAGIRAAYVVVEFSTTYQTFVSPFGYSHALNAFRTTDRGLVFVDVTRPFGAVRGSFDCIVDVKVGQPYVPVPLFSYVELSPLGIVKSVSIQW